LVEESRNFLGLTFTTLDDRNRAIVSGNLKHSHSQLAIRAVLLAEAIDELISGGVR
jgi:hypothetical protein